MLDAVAAALVQRPLKTHPHPASISCRCRACACTRLRARTCARCNRRLTRRCSCRRAATTWSLCAACATMCPLGSTCSSARRMRCAPQGLPCERRLWSRPAWRLRKTTYARRASCRPADCGLTCAACRMHQGETYGLNCTFEVVTLYYKVCGIEPSNLVAVSMQTISAIGQLMLMLQHANAHLLRPFAKCFTNMVIARAFILICLRMSQLLRCSASSLLPPPVQSHWRCKCTPQRARAEALHCLQPSRLAGRRATRLQRAGSGASHRRSAATLSACVSAAVAGPAGTQRRARASRRPRKQATPTSNTPMPSKMSAARAGRAAWRAQRRRQGTPQQSACACERRRKGAALQLSCMPQAVQAAWEQAGAYHALGHAPAAPPGSAPAARSSACGSSRGGSPA